MWNGYGFAPTWLRSVSLPLLHMTTLTTASFTKIFLWPSPAKKNNQGPSGNGCLICSVSIRRWLQTRFYFDSISNRFRYFRQRYNHSTTSGKVNSSVSLSTPLNVAAQPNPLNWLSDKVKRDKKFSTTRKMSLYYFVSHHILFVQVNRTCNVKQSMSYKNLRRTARLNKL